MRSLLFILLFIPLLINGQHVCGADEYNQKFIDANPKKYQQIEKDLQDFLNYRHKKSGSILLPVVYHVVWHDTVHNLHDSILHAQLEVLNECFNLENGDTTILTDTLKNLPGNFGIRFELAHTDPSGNPTNGITRTYTPNLSFSYSNNAVKFDSLGGKNAWDPKLYLNIWVAELGGGLLGYSQFPGGPILTDGNVIDYAVTGNRMYPWTYGSNYAMGRVLVHEIGHWLNLYHPWWGGGASWCGDDGVDDTGIQDGPTFPNAGCPDTSFSNCTPSEREIVKIYMDYCGDSCMVMFTQGQVERGLASLYTYRQTMIDSFTPNPPVDTPELIKEGYKIFPTITSGEVNIQWGEDITPKTIKVYDLKGSIVHTSTVGMVKETKINLSKLSNGLYLLHVLGVNDEIFSQKITIAKGNPFGTELEKEEGKEK